MSNALVIQVLPGLKGQTGSSLVVVQETPQEVPAKQQTCELACSHNEEPFVRLMQNGQHDTSVVRACGTHLFDALYKIPLFAATPLVAQVHTPIYFKLESIAAENLPWEALWHTGSGCFVALEQNWPIARLPPATHQTQRPSTIEPELTMLLVLAAAPNPGDGRIEVDAMSEWQAIWQALTQAPAPYRLRVHVLSCQDDVIAEIEALQDPRVRLTCEPMASAQTFHQALATLNPNIVHFFCHGSAEGSTPTLMLASRSDYDAGAPDGSIMLGISELSALARSESVWLTIFNCCQGGRAGVNGNSLAAALSKQGVPAVVAMRESVDFRAAGRFAGQLHRELIVRLSALLPDAAAVRASAEVRIAARIWSDAMHAARATLAGPRREHDPTWTLPVLYLQRGDLITRARPRSASALMLLPDAARNNITALRMTAAEMRKMSAQHPTLQLPYEALEQQADAEERDALEALLSQGAGLHSAARELAAERLDDLRARS